jgi:hypothetical protein
MKRNSDGHEELVSATSGGKRPPVSASSRLRDVGASFCRLGDALGATFSNEFACFLQCFRVSASASRRVLGQQFVQLLATATCRIGRRPMRLFRFCRR